MVYKGINTQDQSAFWRPLERNKLFYVCVWFQGTLLPGSHAIERYLIEEQIDRIIHTNYVERKDWSVFHMHI